MPPLADADHVLRYQIKHTVGEDTDIITTLHFRWAGGTPDVSDALAFAVSGVAHWVSFLKPLMFTGNTLASIRVTDLTTSMGADATNAVSDAGSRAGSFMPAGACMLTNYLISRRYRGGKPRSYWPFGVQGDMTDGQKWDSGFTSASTTAVEDFVAAVLLDTSGSTTISAFLNINYFHSFTPVKNPITGRYRNVPNPVIPPGQDVITAIVANPRIAYQRRRSVR